MDVTLDKLPQFAIILSMTKITSTIFEDVESWLKENLQYIYVDGICAIQRMAEWNLDGTTRFENWEEETEKFLTLQDFVEGMKKLVKEVDGKKLFVGGVKSGVDLADIDNWDVEVCDALFQLAYLGEVIYG